MSTSQPPNPALTPDQLLAYYTRISLPQHHRHAPGPTSQSIARDPTTSAGLTFLTALQRHHLASIPFENLDLHYSKHHDVLIDPDSVYSKIVSRGDARDGREGISRGRGGYCFESNGLFGLVLQSLGFDAYQTGARVNGTVEGGPDTYGPWNHRITIVTLGPTSYLVDVGFGAGTPLSPVPLLETPVPSPIPNLPSQHIRLLRARIPDSRASDQKLWVYQGKKGDGDALWLPNYCFSETEFLPADFESLNFFTSRSRKSWFTVEVMCCKFLLSGGGGGENDGNNENPNQAGEKVQRVVGYVSLVGKTVKRHLHGETAVVAHFDTEAGRVRALDEWFGVKLSEGERVGMRGLRTALPD